MKDAENISNDEELQTAIDNTPAEKVTEDYINSRIKSVEYDNVWGNVTLCNITLDNGFSVRGESACVNPENFDPKIGNYIAHKNAFSKLWLLFGFLLTENGTLKT